jgi:hypothetical protein
VGVGNTSYCLNCRSHGRSVMLGLFCRYVHQ